VAKLEPAGLYLGVYRRNSALQVRFCCPVGDYLCFIVGPRVNAREAVLRQCILLTVSKVQTPLAIHDDDSAR
jgi:hypothetical protein